MNDTTAPGRLWRTPGAAVAQRISGVLEKIEDAASVGVVAAMFVLIFGQVVARYVIPVPIFWIEEVARTGMVWLTFIAAALVTARMSHLAVTSLTDTLPAKVRYVVHAIGEFAVLATAIVLIPATLHVVEALSGVASSSGVFPRSALFVGPLIGWTLMAIHAFINIVWKDLSKVKSEFDV